jgi:transcriptional regulator with XRE-family HTH domain
MVKKAKKTGQRASSEADVALGIKIRVRRLEAKMSQEQLADHLGVSFQQVQKYEKGVNRVSVMRLQQISKALGESADYFTGVADTKQTTELTALLTDAPSQRLLKAFSKIAATKMRYEIVHLVESISAKAA